jgi:hypothetical protein
MLKTLKYHYDRHQLIRFILNTYPKQSLTFFTFMFVGLVVLAKKNMNENREQVKIFKQGLHSSGKSVKVDNTLFYTTSSKESKSN